MTGVTKARGGYAVTIRNVGGMVPPVDLVVTYTDGTTETVHQTARIWEKNQKQATASVRTTKVATSVELAGGIWMDADLSNNTWRRSDP